MNIEKGSEVDVEIASKDSLKLKVRCMRYEEVVTEKLIPCFIAGFSVLIVIYFFSWGGAGINVLFASLGSSAFIITSFPDTRFARLRNVLLSYLFGGIFGLISSQLVDLGLVVYGAGFLAVFGTSSAMLLCRSIHPPASGAALAFVIYRREYTFEFLMLFFAILGIMVVGKLLIYIYKKEMNIEEFKHEFVRRR